MRSIEIEKWRKEKTNERGFTSHEDVLHVCSIGIEFYDQKHTYIKSEYVFSFITISIWWMILMPVLLLLLLWNFENVQFIDDHHRWTMMMTTMDDT